MQLLVSSTLLIYAVSTPKGRILNNRITRFFSSISMEMYLSHMLIFRLFEKLNWNHIFKNDILQYIVLSLSVIAGTSLFAIVVKKLIKIAEAWMERLLRRIRKYAEQYKASDRQA